MGLPRVRFVCVFMGIEVWVGFTKGALVGVCLVIGVWVVGSMSGVVNGDWRVGWGY